MGVKEDPQGKCSYMITKTNYDYEDYEEIV